MKWVSEPPKIGGYYWVKHDIFRHAEDARDKDIGLVEFDLGTGSICLIGDDESHAFDEIEMWSDEPIDEPMGGNES